MLTRILYIILLLSCSFGKSHAQNQHISQEDLDSLANYELALSGFAGHMVNAEDEKSRLLSSFYFIKTLIKAFRIEGSYYYPFDSVKQYVSLLPSPDEQFRIFTWNLALESQSYRFFGAIQLNPDKASDDKIDASRGKYFFPLIDRSDSIKNPLDTTVNFDYWYGALYYKIVLKKHEGKEYYTLLGWDGNDRFSNMKTIDVLTFEDGLPQFGAPIFHFNPKQWEKQSRVIIEFSEIAAIVVRYEEDEDIIIFEHVAPVKATDEGHPETYLPDGTFDYLEFEDGIWVKKEILFSDKQLPND